VSKTPSRRVVPRAFTLSLLSGILLWAAFPPVGWSWLGWIAPVPWLWLVRDEAWRCRRPYVWVWAAASIHWLAVLQGIRLPYWILYFGWIALSLYVAVYLPVFVAATRVAVHRWRVPLPLAAPIAWVACEFVRGHAITGFSGALLGHTQVRVTPLIQIADLGGAYAVSFLIMLVAGCLASLDRSRRGTRTRLAVAALAVLAALAYGAVRRLPPAESDYRAIRVALLQGTFNTVFEAPDPERNRAVFEQYLRVAERAAGEQLGIDLMVWPESTFSENNPNWLLGDTIVSPDGSTVDSGAFESRVREREASFRAKCAEVARRVRAGQEAARRAASSGAADGATRATRQLVGVETINLLGPHMRTHNSALLLDPDGRSAARYDKVHLVMFGEYIPFGDRFPWIYSISPMAGGLTPGDGPVPMTVGSMRLVPSVCFESFVPHLVRSQVATLIREGMPPDLLVNVTHDGWFWGSSMLDLHLACSVFRAVEHRRPMLVAANPGLTASIDGDGRIRRELPRLTEDYLFDVVGADTRWSLYSRLGDLPAAVCLVVTVGWCAAHVQDRWRRSRGSQGAASRSAG